VLDGHRYASRIAVWRLSDGKLLLRIKREPPGDALMGGLPAKDTAAEAARLRQAQSCALALAVRREIGDDAVGPKPDANGPTDAPKPEPSSAPSSSASSTSTTPSAIPSAGAAPSASSNAPRKP
jgi:hypothetical protein